MVAALVLLLLFVLLIWSIWDMDKPAREKIAKLERLIEKHKSEWGPDE